MDDASNTANNHSSAEQKGKIEMLKIAFADTVWMFCEDVLHTAFLLLSLA
jgi:hypothetical protein